MPHSTAHVSFLQIMGILSGPKKRGARATMQPQQPSPTDNIIQSLMREKVSIKELFGERKVKRDGTEGKTVELPPVHELHTDRAKLPSWIDYSALDAQATWALREALKR